MKKIDSIEHLLDDDTRTKIADKILDNSLGSTQDCFRLPYPTRL